jgi:hypothetical protein
MNCKCGENLSQGETRCPACRNKKDRNWKKGVEIGGVIIAAIGAIVVGIKKNIIKKN